MAKPEVVVITGASSGVGRAIARRFAADGAQIALLARGRQGLEGTRKEVEAAGGKALALPTDVADPAAVEAAAAAAEEALGAVDVWVNNAMTTVFSWFDQITPEEFTRATEVTYLGTVWGTKAALELMEPRNRGAIVQVGSAMAYRGIPLQSPYCGAKHAIKGFQESIRTELRNKGSRVHLTMVQLPGLNTPQFDHCRNKMPKRPMPVPPIYQPDVAAEAVHWAAHAGRPEVYVGVPAVYTILGNKLAPRFAEWYLARTAVENQQTDQESEARPDNLFDPVEEDPGARGRFDSEAHEHSVQLPLTRHRGMLGGAAVLAGAGAAATFLMNRR